MPVPCLLADGSTKALGGGRIRVLDPQRPLSTHELSELALDALTEIGRSIAGKDADLAPVRALGDNLLQTAGSVAIGEQQFSLVPPDYFQPLERLFKDHRSVPPETIEQIRSFVHEVGNGLASFDGSVEDLTTAKDLRKFCLGFHRALMDELRKEDASASRDWSGDDGGAEASLRAA